MVADHDVAAELAVRNLVARLALLADVGNLDEYQDLFTEDAVWDFPGAPRRGRADIRGGAEERRAAGTTGPRSHTRHVITTLAVSVDSPEDARADSYFLFYRDTDTVPTLFNMGQYRDRCRWTEGRWRLAHRAIVIG